MRVLRLTGVLVVTLGLVLLTTGPANADTVLQKKSWSWSGTARDGTTATCTLTDRVWKAGTVDQYRFYAYATADISCSKAMSVINIITVELERLVNGNWTMLNSSQSKSCINCKTLSARSPTATVAVTDTIRAYSHTQLCFAGEPSCRIDVWRGTQ